MKLLYAAFDPVPFPKGSAVRIEATVRALAAAGAKVRLVTPEQPREVEGFPSRLQVDGVEHQTVSCSGDHFLDRAMAYRQAVRQAVAQGDEDLLMFRSIWEGLPMVESGKPVVYEAHGFPSVELPSHYPGVLGRPELLDRFVAQEQLCLHKARLVLTPSATGRTYLMTRGVNSDRIRVIPNSILAEDFPAPNDPPASTPFRLAYMGTMAPWQGLITLFEALGRLKGRVDLKLFLAGPRKGRWMRQAKEAARGVRVRSMVEFTGPMERAELHRFLQTCHLFLAPLPNDVRNSAQGCCPIKILEYMACGRPVLSTAIRPVAELLSHGETGWLVAPNSSYSLARGITHLLENPELCASLSDKARQVVVRDFHRSLFDRRVAALVDEIGEKS